MGISANPANRGQLVETFVNSAYDKVETVHDNLAAILRLSASFGDLQAGTTFPATKSDGNTLDSGDLFFNEATNVLYVYNATTTTWVSITNTSSITESITVDATMASTGVLTTANPYVENSDSIAVFVQGVYQLSGTDYTETDQNTITFPPNVLNEGELVAIVMGTVLATGDIGGLQYEEVQTTTADQAAGTTGFTISASIRPTRKSNLAVYIQGARQQQDAFNYDPNTGIVTFAGEYPNLGDKVAFVTGELVSTMDVPDAAAVPYTPAGTGAVVTNVQSKLRQTIWLEDFGAIPNDSTKAVANYAACRAAVAHVLSQVSANTAEWESIDTVPTINVGPGNFWIEGHNPFGMTLAELQALGVGNATFRRGFKLLGQGRASTIFTLKNAGSETWFYTDTDISVDDSSTSMKGQQFVFEGFTLRGSDLTLSSARKYRVAAASTVNGFYFNANGGGSFQLFKDLTIEGIDTCVKIRGSGNGDQHSYINVYFSRIIDTVFDYNNDQSVTNIVFNSSVLTYGDVVKIGPKGGGDLSWRGGSILLYPRYDTGNITSDVYNTGNPSGVLHYDMETVSTGVVAGAGNSKNHFIDIRFEMYGEGKHSFFCIRDDLVNYGACYGHFTNCRFQNDYSWDSVADTNITRTTFKNIAYIIKQTAEVTYDNCVFGEFLKFTVQDVGSSAQPGGYAQIVIKNSGLLWDTTSSSKSTLASRCVQQIVTSDRCQAKFISDGNYSTIVGQINALACEDFYFTSGNRGGYPGSPLIWANAKPSHVVWPSTAGSDKRLYLPEGSVVTSVFLNKAAAVSGAGSATYRIELQSQSGTVLYASANHQEEDAYVEKTDLATPFQIPAAPNNFVRIQGVNGNAVNVTQSTDGVMVVGYMTGQNRYIGTTPF